MLGEGRTSGGVWAAVDDLVEMRGERRGAGVPRAVGVEFAVVGTLCRGAARRPGGSRPGRDEEEEARVDEVPASARSKKAAGGGSSSSLELTRTGMLGTQAMAT